MPRPPTKAEAISRTLASRIIEGQLIPGSWLSPERELAKEFSVDRSTVRRACQMLAEQGLVSLHPGSGVQVRSDEPVRRNATDITRQVGDWRGFHVSAQQSGHDPYTDVTIREIETDTNLARWLGVPIGTPILERRRIQGVAAERRIPIQIATTCVILSVVDQVPVLRQVNTGPGGIYSRLAELGLEILFEESVTCRLPLADELDVLEIRPDEPVLTTWRRAYDQNERIVEVTHRVVVGDRQELIYRYGARV